jgi:hypothetical protein
MTDYNREPLDPDAFYVCEDLKITRNGEQPRLKQQPSWHNTRLSPAMATRQQAEQWQHEHNERNPQCRTVIRPDKPIQKPLEQFSGSAITLSNGEPRQP